jgi:hypothetical protein
MRRETLWGYGQLSRKKKVPVEAPGESSVARFLNWRRRDGSVKLRWAAPNKIVGSLRDESRIQRHLARGAHPSRVQLSGVHAGQTDLWGLGVMGLRGHLGRALPQFPEHGWNKRAALDRRWENVPRAMGVPTIKMPSWTKGVALASRNPDIRIGQVSRGDPLELAPVLFNASEND